MCVCRMHIHIHCHVLEREMYMHAYISYTTIFWEGASQHARTHTRTYLGLEEKNVTADLRSRT